MSLIQLPPPARLDVIARGLATLDALLSEEWDYRYYSFKARWADGERLASMRDGCGDDWFLVLTDDRAFLKGLAHDRAQLDATVLYAGLPAALAKQLAEPAFAMDRVSYGGWWEAGAWTLRCAPGAEPRMHEHLKLLQGNPAEYREYAEDYFEADVPLGVVEHVLAGRPLDDQLVQSISQRSLVGLAADLDEIDYQRRETLTS